MTGPVGVLATSDGSEPGAVGDRVRLSTGRGEGGRGGTFGEGLKDRCCTERGGCGGDGTWTRKKGTHCGGQPTPPTEECNPELLGCRSCSMVLLIFPFEHCATRFGSVSGSGCSMEVQKCGTSACREGADMQKSEEMHKSVLWRCGGDHLLSK